MMSRVNREGRPLVEAMQEIAQGAGSRSWWDEVMFRFLILRYQIRDLWEYRNKPLSPDLYSWGEGMYDYSDCLKPTGFQENYFYMPLMQIFLQNLASIPVGQGVLDLGSGVGAESEFLKKTFPHLFVASLDLSTVGTHVGKKRGLNQVQGLAQKLPFPDESFLAVHSKDLLVHIKNKRQFFQEVSRVMQPNGYFCLVSAGAMPVHIATQYKWKAEDLVNQAAKNGFKMLEYDNQPLRVEDWYRGIDIPRLFFLFQKTDS